MDLGVREKRWLPAAGMACQRCSVSDVRSIGHPSDPMKTLSTKMRYDVRATLWRASASWSYFVANDFACFIQSHILCEVIWILGAATLNFIWFSSCCVTAIMTWALPPCLQSSRCAWSTLQPITLLSARYWYRSGNFCGKKCWSRSNTSWYWRCIDAMQSSVCTCGIRWGRVNFTIHSQGASPSVPSTTISRRSPELLSRVSWENYSYRCLCW